MVMADESHVRGKSSSLQRRHWKSRKEGETWWRGDLKNVQDWRFGEKQEAVEGGEDGNRGRGSDLEAGRAGGTKCQKDPAKNRCPAASGRLSTTDQGHFHSQNHRILGLEGILAHTLFMNEQIP